MDLRKRTILITGNPGSGKSTLMARLIEDIGDRHIAGLSTPEVRVSKVRVGFKMVDLATGDEVILASNSGKGPRIGNYHVDVEAIDRIVAKIELSLPSARFVFIDEIGKMELLSNRFNEFLHHVFSLDKPIMAVVHRNLVRKYENKGRLFNLTRGDFEEVRAEILAEIKSWRPNL
jgi:nucleoside-triphosphatase